MKSLMIKMSLVAFTVMTMAGCATFSKAPSDEELIIALATGVTDAIEAQDIDALVAYYSEDFMTDEGTSKEDVKTFLTGAKAAGFLDGIKVDISTMNVEVDGDKATAGPIELEGQRFTMSLDFKLEKRDGKWMVVEMAQY